jgi:hypothetical protein
MGLLNGALSSGTFQEQRGIPLPVHGSLSVHTV